MTAHEWLRRLDLNDLPTRRTLDGVYGSDTSILRERVRLLHAVLQQFAQRFGEIPVRVFRSPGRVNLRGMHVDTHGGFLNLMTHQREVVIAAAATDDDLVNVANINPAFPDVSFRITDQSSHPAFQGDWNSFILAPEILNAVKARPSYWGNYVQGCVLNAQHRFQAAPLRGMRGVIGSDLPRGAALSSSGALLVATLTAILGLNAQHVTDSDAILAVREAEWYAGSRIGVSDQAAMLLGGKDSVVNTALHASCLDERVVRRVLLPPEVSVLVINSYTERSLSGAHLVEYTRNRFAYSLALEILRQEMRSNGFPEDFADSIQSLAAITPQRFDPHGGVKAIYRLLALTPEQAPLSVLKERYQLPVFDSAYADFFGTVPEHLRPTEIALRGPLLFGIAESERARVFADAVEQRDYVRMGRLMSTGHNGDRRVTGAGQPYRYDVSDAAITGLAKAAAPIEWCPGVYGASSPVLDCLVDEALEAGALGASLTGAGIAGAVIALCHAADASGVSEAIRARMATIEYTRLANRAESLTEEELRSAVVINQATAGAGEVALEISKQ